MTDPITSHSLAELRRALLTEDAVVSCPAPSGRAQRLVDVRLGNFSLVWEERNLDVQSCGLELERSGTETEASTAGRPPSSSVRAVAGLDAACVVTSSREESAETAENLASCDASIARALSALRLPPRLVPWVRFWGGSAFTTGRDGSGCWADFGEATFVLPRYLYVDAAAGAELLIFTKNLIVSKDGRVEERSIPHAELLRGAELCLRALHAPLDSPPVDPSSTGSLEVLERRTSADQKAFFSLVGAARQEIERGEVSKVVAARRVTLTLSAKPNLAQLLHRLSVDAPGTTRFLFRIGERCFVGATPELLISKRGRSLRTEALAGTRAIQPGGSAEHAGAELQQSRKDQAEHRFVVGAIEQALRQSCSSIDVPPTPLVRRLSHLVHLWTPIRATQNAVGPGAGESVLGLVRKLHPTPAVGGLPRAAALDFIRKHEEAERGWYAAPFGFVDAEGNGDFVVTLRSALLHDCRVHLFAGAGIIADSDPQAEFEETELKLGAMQRALGIA
jgi:isochorismate synthase